MQKFCHNCGKQVTVGANFCASCGTSLTSLSNTPAPPPVTQRPQGQFTPFAVGKDDDEDGSSYIDKMEHLQIRQNTLQIEIVRDNPLGVSIGNVVQQSLLAGKPPTLEGNRIAAPAVDKAQFLQEFQQEAGAMRRNERNHSQPIPKDKST